MLTDPYLTLLLCGISAMAGTFAGIGLKLTVDYAELAAYRRIARSATHPPADADG